VQDALRKGYDINTVKNWLLKNNANPHELEEVIRLVSSQNTNTAQAAYSTPDIEMQLRNYVQQQLRNGYAADMIRMALIRQGHNAFLVDKIINENVNINIRHEVHVSGKTIFGIVFSLFLVAGLVYILFFSNLILNKNIPLLDVSIQSNKDTYYPGDIITYNIELISTGTQKRFDANVRYVILDENDAVKKSYSETIAVETRATSSGSITIPTTLNPGRYYLKAIVDYGGETPASSMTEIYITAKEDTGQPEIIIPTGTVRDNTTTTTINTNTNTQQTTTKETFGDTINIVRQQAKINANIAVRICDRSQSQDQKDICYSTVAEASSNSSYCDIITKTTYRDNCYLSFIMTGDTKVCDKIIDNSTKLYCNQIRIVEQMNYYYQQNNTAKILELSKQFEPSIYNSNPAPITYNNEYKQPATIDDFAIKDDLTIKAEINASNDINNETTT
jgi:hypothetical protein